MLSCLVRATHVLTHVLAQMIHQTFGTVEKKSRRSRSPGAYALHASFEYDFTPADSEAGQMVSRMKALQAKFLAIEQTVPETTSLFALLWRTRVIWHAHRGTQGVWDSPQPQKGPPNPQSPVGVLGVWGGAGAGRAPAEGARSCVRGEPAH